MGVKSSPSPSRRRRVLASQRNRAILFIFATTVVLSLWIKRRDLATLSTLLSLPVTWQHDAPTFYLSAERDDFDITFANYSTTQTSASSPHEDRVPPILHQIALSSAGGRPAEPGRKSAWHDARQSCIDFHPGWEAKLWTDKEAAELVERKYPHLKSLWYGYRFPIQRIDALRYMVLYEYGGVILDMDLKCKRALGPLRRFDFVAPAANPTGFSIGFMMAARKNEFVGKLVDSLATYNRRWFWLPYPTVMFSTGCHYASTIHASLLDRSRAKIIGGTAANPALHRLSGRVSTPIFDHLGSSSWHSFDGEFLRSVGRPEVKRQLVCVSVVGFAAIFVAFRLRRRAAIMKLLRGRSPSPKRSDDIEGRLL